MPALVTVGAVKVGRAPALPVNVTVVPLVWVQDQVTAWPSMSNEAEPSRAAFAPEFTVRSGPAFAVGARFAPAVPCPRPSCIAFRMSPLSASISHAKIPARPFERTYAPFTLTESALS